MINSSMILLAEVMKEMKLVPSLYDNTSESYLSLKTT